MKAIKDIEGLVLDSKAYGQFQVLERVENSSTGKVQHKIRFLNTGTIDVFMKANILKGLVKDRFAKTIHGVACVGNATKVDNKKAYDTWFSMIDRCYNPNHSSFEYYGGKGVTVSEEWKCFEYFLKDLPQIQGYDRELFESGLLHLDKDIRQKDVLISDKIYSLQTCYFIEPSVNMRETDKRNMVVTMIATSPEGKEIQFTNARQFALEHGFAPSQIVKSAKSNGKYHNNGWTFRYVN